MQLYFVFGLPGETKKTVKETLAFIKLLPLTKEDSLNYFTPYPGSRLWEEQDNYRIKIREHDFSNYDCQHVIFETEQLDFKSLKELYSSTQKIESFFK